MFRQAVTGLQLSVRVMNGISLLGGLNLLLLTLARSLKLWEQGVTETALPEFTLRLLQLAASAVLLATFSPARGSKRSSYVTSHKPNDDAKPGGPVISQQQQQLPSAVGLTSKPRPPSAQPAWQ